MVQKSYARKAPTVSAETKKTKKTKQSWANQTEPRWLQT